MAVTERKDTFIHLPVVMIFTREGLALLNKANNPNVKKVTGREGAPREGLDSASYNAPTVQKMIMNSYLEEIYVCLPDLLRKRHEIISTNNMVLYSILYKKLTPALAQMLFSSPVVADFNRKNPKHSMVDLKHINRQSADKLVTAKGDLFKQVRDEIYETVLSLNWNSESLTPEEKEVRIRSLPKFINWIDNRIWYLYYIIYQTPLRDEMQKSFAKMISRYLDHTRLATHLSNLLMEFVQNAEKASFERLIVRNNMAAREEVDTFIRNRQNREFVIKEAEKQGQMLQLSWNMNSERSSIGRQFRVLTTISNYGLIDEKIRRDLSTKMKTDVEGISLANFYQDSGDTGKLGAGLGLLYNSYLEDLCKKEGLFYRCNIYPEARTEKTTVQIEIAL